MFGLNESEVRELIHQQLKIVITDERATRKYNIDYLHGRICVLEQQFDELLKYLDVKLELNTEKPSPYKVVPR